MLSAATVTATPFEASVSVLGDGSTIDNTMRTPSQSVLKLKLRGGLGNQLFQFAFGYSLARKYGLLIELDASSFNSWRNTAHRSFELDHFAITNRRIAEQGIGELPPRPESRPTKRWNKKVHRLVEPWENRQIMTLPPGFDVYEVEGYWQSETFFQSYRAEIRKLLLAAARPPRNNSNGAADLVDKSVNVQIRRGDYVSNKATKAMHGVMGLDYFKRGLDHLALTVDIQQLQIFSDDREWCANNVDFGVAQTVVDSGPGASPGNELLLLAAGRNFIISNSTFGWWGAWMAQSDHKNVVAPERWHSVARRDRRPICPAEWKLL